MYLDQDRVNGCECKQYLDKKEVKSTMLIM